jgi:predicted permease
MSMALAESVGRDLRHAVRVLKRAPAFAATAVVTLALVIGACTAVFSLADAILLRPLPYPEPERLALIEMTTRLAGETGQGTWVDGAMWEAVRDHVPALDAMVFATTGGANLSIGEAAAYVTQHRVSAGFFRVLGVPLLHGREFSADEDRQGGPALAVLSYDLWRRFFRSDPAIVGQSILLRGEPYVVTGVTAKTFRSLEDVDVWTPLRGSSGGEGGGTNFQVAARLKPGATWTQATNELAAVHDEAFRLLKNPPEAVRSLGVTPLQEALSGESRQPIVLLSWAVGAVLLIACVNLAALLLARGTARRREIATRMALGSGRRTVVRQLMTEAVLIAVVGGALGVLVGQLALQVLKVSGGQIYSEWEHVTLDGRVLAVTAGLSLLTSVLFGLVPALQASRLDVQAALTDAGSRGIAGGTRHWPRRLLVAGEVALGVVLLVCAGLLLRTFVSLKRLDPGFDPDRLVTASVSLQDARYTTASAINRLFDDSLRRLRAAPGIESASVSLELPYDRLLNMGFRFTDVGETQSTVTNVSYVTPDFLKTLRIPLKSGRDLSETDTAGSLTVVVVNEIFARIYSPDRPAVGRRLRVGSVEREIVGVVGDVRQRRSFSIQGVERGPIVSLPLIMIPAAQTADGLFRTAHTWFTPVWTVRSRSTAEGARAIAEAVSAADPRLPLSSERSMSEVMAGAMATQRLLMSLVGVLAAAAILLAAIGIQGLVAHSVAERRREFGIRIALGATPGQTVRGVALGGVALAAGGAIVGLLVSIPAVSLVESFLWNVRTHDPLTYVGVAVLLFVVATIASVIPALKILRLDPAKTLQ